MIGIGLPDVVRRDATMQGQLTLELDVDQSLPCLDGHFPSVAVVPGVAQLSWAVHFAAEHWGLPLSVSDVSVLKFQNLARPPLRLTLQLEQRNGKVLFSVDSDQGRHASGRLTFGDGHV